METVSLYLHVGSRSLAVKFVSALFSFQEHRKLDTIKVACTQSFRIKVRIHFKFKIKFIEKIQGV